MTSNGSGGEIRGIFPEFDPISWQAAVQHFPNQVPRFKTKAECIEFTEAHMDTSSNPDEPSLKHSVSTLTDWNQIEKYVFPKVRYYRDQADKLPDPCTLEDNVFLAEQSPSGIHDHLVGRLNLPIHACNTEQSTLNTFEYLYHTMRCGIYVMIKNGKLVIFCPFVNKDYTNNWNGRLQISGSGSIEDYYLDKNSNENYIPDMNKWWANGNIICNVHGALDEETQWWGDHFLFQLKDMLSETCNARDVPDCEFFVNKRDYPQLKFNDILGPVEPYGFIFDKDDKDATQDIPLESHVYKSYAPILSFYSSTRFADVPFPTSEDWEAATGEVFPPSFISETVVMQDDKLQTKKRKEIKPPRDLFTSENLKKFQVPWSEKENTAFFRGTATGGGVTAETNQRLNVAQLSHIWATDESPDKGPARLDAKLVGWNFRDKKIFSEKTKYVKKKDFPFQVGQMNRVPIYEQSRFKYLLYIEGHCAACRYGFMMILGSVILKVESRCVADQMWYFPLLRPGIDHIPVKADLSDLKEKIDWCREHDEECMTIAENAAALYHKFISREGILDYMQMTCYEIAKRFLHVPSWARNPPKALSPPQKKPGQILNLSSCCKDGGLCMTCQKLKKVDDESKHTLAEKTLREDEALKDQRKNYKQIHRDRATKRKATEQLLLKSQMDSA